MRKLKSPRDPRDREISYWSFHSQFMVLLLRSLIPTLSSLDIAFGITSLRVEVLRMTRLVLVQDLRAVWVTTATERCQFSRTFIFRFTGRFVRPRSPGHCADSRNQFLLKHQPVTPSLLNQEVMYPQISAGSRITGIIGVQGWFLRFPIESLTFCCTEVDNEM